MIDYATVETTLDDVYAKAKRELAGRGGKAIELSRSWFDAEAILRGDRELVANVPVGRDLALPVVAADRGADQFEELADRFAQRLPQALVSVEAAKWSLRRYAGSVRRASEAAIAESRSAGLDLSLACVTFQKTSVFNLAQEDWRNAQSYILAEVHVSRLDRDLRPHLHRIVVEEAEEVADAIAELRKGQKEYQDARDALRLQGASARVDEITLRLMDRYGLDRIETLRTVLREGHVNVEVTKKDGATGNLYIGNQLGNVHSTIIDERNFDWLGDYLSFRGPDSPDDLERFVNRPVNDVCPDALFSGMTLGALRSSSCRSQLSIDQPVHFVDLDQGRFWEARLAA